FPSALARLFAGQSQAERCAAAGDHVIEDEVAAHPAHQGTRDVQTETAAVAAGAARGAAREATEQPGPVALLETPAAIGDRRPKGALGRVDADVDRDRALSVLDGVV